MPSIRLADGLLWLAARPEKSVGGGPLKLVSRVVGSLLLVLIFDITFGLAAGVDGAPEAEIIARLHRLVNEFRKEQRLEPLTLDPTVSAEARKHSARMSRRKGGTIGHRGFQQRIQEIRDKIPYRVAAENVALNLGYEDPARVAVESWKDSPEHRKNLLGDFSLTGIGVAQGEDGAYFFTQIFIKPRRAAGP
jgi:uncharacterized protein YkwD